MVSNFAWNDQLQSDVSPCAPRMRVMLGDAVAHQFNARLAYKVEFINRW